MRLALLLIPALLLTGCEQLSGASDQKIYDAEAVGYACRISLKKPEDCMKENETQSPSSVLDGWKAADKDIREKVLDVNLGPAMEDAVPVVKDAAPVVDAPKTEEAVKK